MNNFCTLTTLSHLYKVQALAKSIKSQSYDFVLHVVVVDGDAKPEFENCRFWKIENLVREETGEKIISKYQRDKDRLRWGLKSVFMKFLLKQSDIDKLVYLDNDIFFYSDYQFLFNLLEKHSFLLTPHHYKHDPKEEQNWFEANFRVGVFNAGFVGANKTGLTTLQWWADCCAYRCEKNAFRGLFDDQKYLDLVPVLEETAYIVRHKGCNLAGWNIELCKRIMDNGSLKIDGKYAVVFVHYNSFTIRKILEGEDALLLPLYEQYEATLKAFKPGLRRDDLFEAERKRDKLKFNIWKMLNRLGT